MTQYIVNQVEEVKNSDGENFEIYIDKGFPADALKLYEIDVVEFWQSDKKKRKFMLKNGRTLYEKKQRQFKYDQYLTDYEKHLTNQYIKNLRK